MRIAQVSPLYERVPPEMYGGTERVVSYLTEELVRMGHDVTLFSSGDSITSARHVPVGDRALRLDRRCRDPLAHHILMLGKVRRRAADFDLIHFHIDYLHFPLTRSQGWTTLTTYHGRLDIPDLVPLFAEFPELPAASISDEQRRPLPNINWEATVYHGIPEDLLHFSPRPDGYLAFLGRVSPEKGIDRAIDLARFLDLPLKVAAKVGEEDREYYESRACSRLNQPGIDFLGEIGDIEKQQLLGGASALLFPIEWPEPFGMVMIESMACGTPVVAHDLGSVSEVVADGVTGVVIDRTTSIPEAAEAVRRAMSLDRWQVRREFERRFTAQRMAADYEQVYERLVQIAPATLQEEIMALHG